MQNRHLSAGADLRRRPGRSPHDEDARRGLRAATPSRSRDSSRARAGASRSPGPGPRRSWRSGSGSPGSRSARTRTSTATPGEYDEAFLDVWTPEVAPRVARPACRRMPSSAASATSSSSALRCRRSGSRAPPGRRRRPRSSRSSSDGPASRSTRARPPARGTSGRRAELLPPSTDGVVLMELTSSHLCFTTRAPTVAVITCFWPDHLELHGSLERYRAAKEAIVRWQGPDDVVVVNEDDAGAAAIADRSPRDAASASPRPARSRGRVRPREARSSCATRPAIGRFACRRGSTAHVSRRCSPPRRRRLATGALPETLRPPQAPPVPRELTSVGSARTELIDDGMAATPAKTASALDGYARRIRRARRRRASSRAPGSACTPRARSSDCSSRHARRRGASRASSSCSALPPSRLAPLLRSDADALGSDRRRGDRAAPRIMQRAPRCSSSRRCSRSRSRSASGSPRRSRRLRESGISADPPPLVVVTTIMCATKSAPTREEEK